MTRDPWMVACPACGVGMGWPCVDAMTGATLTWWHRSRYDAAGH